MSYSLNRAYFGIYMWIAFTIVKDQKCLTCGAASTASLFLKTSAVMKGQIW